MLKTGLLHPEILLALAAAGHGSRVLVADANFPVSTEMAPTARKVFLNLRPGMVNVTDVLESLVHTIPIESALLMERADGGAVPLHETIRQSLPPSAVTTPAMFMGSCSNARLVRSRSRRCGPLTARAWSCSAPMPP